MSNPSIRGFVFLAVLFLLVTSAVLVLVVLDQPTFRIEMGIPNTGNAIRTGPRPSTTPTPHLIPPISEDVHASVNQSLAEPCGSQAWF